MAVELENPRTLGTGTQTHSQAVQDALRAVYHTVCWCDSYDTAFCGYSEWSESPVGDAPNTCPLCATYSGCPKHS